MSVYVEGDYKNFTRFSLNFERKSNRHFVINFTFYEEFCGKTL